jgi:SAM-dependent methyltransferase
MKSNWNLPLKRMWWFALSSWAYFRARRLNLIGHDFFLFGRKLGREFYRADRKLAWDLIVTPVSSTRYYEFSFARDCLPSEPSTCLDVSSPFLFDIYVARTYPAAHLDIINPDPRDIGRTRTCFQNLQLPMINTVCGDINSMPRPPGGYDVIWSLSVIEHIESKTDNDSSAVQSMFDALRPSGRLIITVPTDKSFQIEYRGKDYYRTQAQSPKNNSEKYFFQRIYDATAIHDRIIRPLGVTPERVGWYGEIIPGHFANYVSRWLRNNKSTTVWDPLEMARYYQIYDSWSAMPGAGVCGLLFIKP